MKTFSIHNDRLDGRDWASVDESAQWQSLKSGMEEGVGGATEAVLEMFAVLKAPANSDLEAKDVWGAHHILTEKGALTLSRSGMIAAASALTSAVVVPGLTDEQRRQAAAHLVRHFTQENVNLQPPRSLIQLASIGEMMYTGRLVSEMKPAAIPLAPGVDLLALKHDDDDPMEVVVEIPAGVSSRGWVYGKDIIKSVAEQVASRLFAGYLGHQRSEDLETEFPQPVTHWVGAVYRGGSVFIRGVVDKAAPDLKRWIRAGAIGQVSIFGYADTELVGKKETVTRLDLLSIDWVPLKRAGMKTRLVAVGEQKGLERTAMDLKELTGELKRLDATPTQVLTAMGWGAKVVAESAGWTLDSVAGEIESTRWESATAAEGLVGEIAGLCGLESEAKPADVLAAVKGALEAKTKVFAAEQEKMIDKVIAEQVSQELARPIIKRMLQVGPDADEAAVTKAVGEMLAAEDVKQAFTPAVLGAIIPKTSKEDKGQKVTRKVRI